MTTPLSPDARTPPAEHEPSARSLVEDFLRNRQADETRDPFALILAHPHLAGELERLLEAEIQDYLALQSSPRTEGQSALAPATIGRYRIDGRLGAGSSSVVYHAYDPKFQRSVALKVVRGDPTADSSAVGRFERDARTLARLRHPHIVPLHETGESDGLRWIDMERVSGETLEARLGRPPLPAFRWAAELVQKVAEALHYAHQAGVVHRDVKPSNILLDAAGAPQLADFGLARRIGADESLTLPGQLLGTPAYMSPEQARLQPHEADARSDVYSLGVVFYRLLTGRLPFEGGDSPASLLRKIETEEPPALRRLRPDVPADLVTICLKALEKRPEDRFATAGAFGEELWRWLHDEPLTIRRPTRWELARRWFHRQGRMALWLLTTASVLVTLSAALGWVTWTQHERATLLQEARAHVESWSLLDQAWLRVRSTAVGRRFETQRLLREVVTHRQLITDPEDVERIDRQVRSLFASSLSVPDLRVPEWGRAEQTQDAVLSAWPVAIHPNGEWLVVSLSSGPQRWDRGTQFTLPVDLAVSRARPRLGFSPDGHFLTVAPVDGGLDVWNESAKQRLKVLRQRGTSAVLAVGYSADGGTLWACCADGSVHSWSLSNFREGSVWTADAGSIWTAARFNSGATQLATGRADGLVDVYGTADRAVRALNDGETRTRIERLAWSPDNRLLAIGMRDGRVELWDDGLTKLIHRFTPFGGAVEGMEFTPDGRLLSASGGGMRLWDVATGELLLSNGNAVPLGFSKNGRWLAGGGAGEVYCVELVQPETVRRLRGHVACIEKLTWSRDSRRLASLDTRFQVHTWDVEDGQSVDSFTAPFDSFFAHNADLALGIDGRMLAYASGGEQSKALVRDIAAHQWHGPWKLPGGFEKLVAEGPNQFQLVREQLDEDGLNVHTAVWQLTAERPPKHLRDIRPSSPADARRFIDSGLSADGRLHWWVGPRLPFASRRVEVRRVDNGDRVYATPSPSVDRSEPIAYLDPTGRRLWVYVTTDHTTVRLDLPGGRPMKVDRIPRAASADGEWQTFASYDRRRGDNPLALGRGDTSRFWLEFIGDDSSGPKAGSFSPDSRFVAWGSTSGVITIIDLPALQRAIAAFEAGQHTPE